MRARPGEGQDWKAYARSIVVFSARLADALPAPAPAGHPALEPGGLQLRPLGPQLEHRFLLRDQHQLAVLRRRDDDHLLLADGGADVQNFLSAAVGIAAIAAVIRGIASRSGSRSATSGRTWPGRPSTSCCRSRSLPRSSSSPRAWSRPSAARGPAPGGRRCAALGVWTGCFAGSDQGVRHQRWRLLQRQQRLSVRELQRPDQLRGDAAYPHHPREPSPTPSDGWSATAARAGRSTSAMC